MTVTLAVAGKGGTGKTTFSALAIRHLLSRGRTPVLAIDADPSSNLNLVLGLPLYETVGQIREDAAEAAGPPVPGAASTRMAAPGVGIARPDWFEYQVQRCLVEGDQVDLLAMGRPEGPGCYCAANHMLRRAVDRLGEDYAGVVIDNEAGLEHISRQTTRNVDWLFIISDPSQRGLAAAEGIVALIASLGSRVAHAGLIINRVRGELPGPLADRAANLGVPLLGVLPLDPAVEAHDVEGRPMITLPRDAPVCTAVTAILDATLG
jgi:CO dehydrogenase maturation factor